MRGISTRIRWRQAVRRNAARLSERGARLYERGFGGRSKGRRHGPVGAQDSKRKTRAREGGRGGRSRRPAPDARDIDADALAAGGTAERGAALGERRAAS
nr:MAG TPA: hypothetical protein [Caudoviricetes sp.]